MPNINLTDAFPNSVIKSIQRGSGVFGVSNYSETIAISSVNTAKSVVSLLGVTSNDTAIQSTLVAINLASATTVQVARDYLNTGGLTTKFNWQVVEYV